MSITGFHERMQKQRIDCPFDVWLNAKICLKDRRRGFAVAKLIKSSEEGELNLLLSCDKNLLSNNPNALFSFDSDSQDFQEANDNLSQLPPGTVVMLSPARIFGYKFWVARLSKMLDTTVQPDKSVLYDLHRIERLDNFMEARSEARVSFSTPVFLIDPESYTSIQHTTYDISPNGLGLIIEPQNHGQTNFKKGKDYYLQLKLPESSTLPPLKYKCIHSREDAITGAEIIGFRLIDPKADDPQIQHNLAFLTWSLEGYFNDDNDLE